MRKLFLACCLVAATAQPACAQGFLKKLGKALGESAKEIVSGGAVTQETPWGNVTIKHLMPNMKITVQDVSRNGNNAVVTLLFTNTSSKKIAIWGLTNRKTFDSQGNEYRSYCQVGQELLDVGFSYSYFESDVPVKVYYIVRDVPTSAFTLRLLKFGTSYDANGSKTETPLEIRNIRVPEAQATTENTNESATNNNSHTITAGARMEVFKGTWRFTPTDQSIDERVIILYGAGKKSESDEGRIIYGEIFTSINTANQIDNDEITKITINGNSANIEYICGRTGDEDEKGKATLTYNPQTKTLTLKVKEYPLASFEGCYTDGCVLKKEK